MSEWIKMTPRLEAGLRAIDELSNEKLKFLINRVCAILQSGNNAKTFTEEEEENLLKTLEVNKATLPILVNTIELIYLQAAYGFVKPLAMESLMKNSFPVSQEKVTIFVNTWTMIAKELVECLRHKSIFPAQVNDVTWKLNIHSSSSGLSQEFNPVAWLQLDLSGPQENSKLNVELDKSDLTNLYNNFEDIQRQLDSFEWTPERGST